MAEDFIKIEIDTKKFEKKLGEHKKKMPMIARKMMRKVNAAIKKDAKKEMRSRHYNTQKENGVYKNLFTWAGKKFNACVFIKRQADLPYYAPFIKYGAHIEAKNSKCLCFKINDQWVKVKSVEIPAKPFLESIIRNYWDTGKAASIMEEVFQKELDKLYQKN